MVGVGIGTVPLVTRRVMTAILRKSFLEDAMRPPSEEEKEIARAWVEKRSCPAWRNGHLMIDGSTIPLYERPAWYGESYFDRKCSYSLNLQVSLFLSILTISHEE